MSEQKGNKPQPRIIKGTGYPVSLDPKPPISSVQTPKPAPPKPTPKSSK